MRKKGNSYIFLLLPIAAIGSCITGSDDSNTQTNADSTTTQVETSAPVIQATPATVTLHQPQTPAPAIEVEDKTNIGDTHCKVVGIADGDTITCLSDGKRQMKVRLNQIDAPEQKQAFGKAAKKALAGYVAGKTISLKTNGHDKYGRTIAEVFVDGKNINKAMVEDGYAWAYREHVTDSEYLNLENAARSQSRGLWSQPNPVYPSEFRHSERPRNVTQDVKPKADVLGGKFTCAGKRFCREMRSCAEAKFYLNQCGVSRLDRDNDGRPCESLC